MRHVKNWHFSWSLLVHCVSLGIKCLCFWIATTLSFPTVPNLLDKVKIGVKYEQKCKVWPHQLDKIWPFFQYFGHKSDKSHSFLMFYTSLEWYSLTLCNIKRKKIEKLSYSMFRCYCMVSKTPKIIFCQ